MYRYLLDVGVSVAHLRAAIVAGDPRQALAEHRLLGDQHRYDVDAVAARAGLTPAAVMDVLRALGLTVPTAGQATLSAPDLQAVQLFAGVQTLFGDDTVLRFGRVMRSAVGRVAEAAVAMFGLNVEDPLLQRGGTQTELTKATDVALNSLPMIPDLFATLFQRQALEAVRRMATAHGGDTSHETVTVSVGFGDLVGSTAWAQDRTPRELGAALGEFERLAQTALSGRARLVKTIGDEVMFMTLTPEDACRTALNLVAALRQSQLPELRVGLAHGRAIALDGDLYGTVVNLAARLVHQAAPGQILADPALVAASRSADVAFTALEPRRLSGFDEPIAPHAVHTHQNETHPEARQRQ